MADLPPYGPAVDRAIDDLVRAIHDGEHVPVAFVRAATQRVLCDELSREVSLRLADAIALVPDRELTYAFVGVLEAPRVPGDETLLCCVRAVLTGRVHYARLSLQQRQRLETCHLTSAEPTSSPIAQVIGMQEWMAARKPRASLARRSTAPARNTTPDIANASLPLLSEGLGG